MCCLIILSLWRADIEGEGLIEGPPPPPPEGVLNLFLIANWVLSCLARLLDDCLLNIYTNNNNYVHSVRKCVKDHTGNREK